MEGGRAWRPSRSASSTSITSAATPVRLTTLCHTASPVAAAYSTSHGATRQARARFTGTDGSQTAAMASINRTNGAGMVGEEETAAATGRSWHQTATGALIGAWC